MDELLSPRQVAEAIGASESSLKRWCDNGLLKTVRTAGGHRRIPLPEVLRFIREQKMEVVDSAILALSATDDRKARQSENASQRMTEVLMEGNEPAARAVLFELYLAGQSVSRIFDEVLAPSFHEIGEKWECHEAEVYQERCSCQIALRLLHELRGRLPVPDSGWRALGATVEGDQYCIPATMAELVLRSQGWDARLLGMSIPFHSLIAALETHRPQLCWLSVSYIADMNSFLEGFQRLFEATNERSIPLVIGGRALTDEIRPRLCYSAFCDTMRQLEAFAHTLRQQRERAPQRA